ncbi:MAG: hypothetical protein GMKNLPBB_01196 [Myxococcota bacterium]|nr:hypothetical protein [Myxococcota bacterium]
MREGEEDHHTGLAGTWRATMKRTTIGRLWSLFPAALLVTACGGDGDSTAKVKVTISGERLGLNGLAYPPAAGQEAAFADGWEVKFEHALVTVDNIRLSGNPDNSPTDKSKTGEAVAELKGPFAADLAKPGPLPGKGGEGDKAFELGVIPNQTLKNGAAFQTDERYAFGYEIVTASSSAKQIGFDEDSKKLYAEMIEKGYSMLVTGTAAWKGQNCTPDDPVFSAMPKTVKIKFAFKSPAQYINCENPDNNPAKPFDGEESQRGIALKTNTETIAQATIHLDHLFFSSFEHDPPLYFDQIAAQYMGQQNPTATLEDMAKVDFQAFKTSDGKPLPWRKCWEKAEAQSGQRSFKVEGVPVDPSAAPGAALRNYADYITYNQTTLGHLNADGLCYTVPKYPSPMTGGGGRPDDDHDH